MIFKADQNLMLRSILDNYMLISVGQRALTNHEMIEISETGAFIWNKLKEQDLTNEQLASMLTEEYDVDYQSALEDVNNFLKELLTVGAVTAVNKSLNI